MVYQCDEGWYNHLTNSFQTTEAPKAWIMHRFLSRSDEGADLTRRTAEAPANVLYGTLRRPTECNAGRADDFVGAVENLCIIRVKVQCFI